MAGVDVAGLVDVLAGAGAAALLGAVGWVINRATARADSQVALNSSEAAKLLLLEHEVGVLRTDVAGIQRHTAALSEELTAVGTIVDRHEQWHARRDPVSRDDR